METNEYFESITKLQDDELSEKIEEMCLGCQSLFFQYVVDNPEKFKNRLISVELYAYALMFLNFYDETNSDNE